MKCSSVTPSCCITDKPSKPTGPIKFTDLTHDSVTLSWQPPDSDGGLPLNNYVIEYHDARRTTWMKAGSVPKDTTTFTCTNLLEGNEYIFRVVAVNDEGESAPLESKESVKPQKEISKWTNLYYFVSVSLSRGVHCLSQAISGVLYCLIV